MRDRRRPHPRQLGASGHHRHADLDQGGDPVGLLAAAIDPYELARAGVLLGVPADPQEIANGVLFLASDASRPMTGSELVIDGGMTAGTARRPA